MTLPSLLEGLPEVKEALTANGRGEILDATGAGARERDVAAFAAAMGELAEAATEIGLGPLELVLLKSASAASVTAVRPDAFLLVVLPPSSATAPVEKVVRRWSSAAEAAPPPPQIAAAAPCDAPVEVPAALPPVPAPALAPPPPSPTWRAREQIAANGSVFSGLLSAFSVPDLLEFLRGAQRTGVLVCSSRGQSATIRFRDGWITSASPQRGTPAERGAVDFGERVEATLRELVQWNDGSFAFRRDERGDEAGADAGRIDVQRALLNVFRQMDEDARAGTEPRGAAAASA